VLGTVKGDIRIPRTESCAIVDTWGVSEIQERRAVDQVYAWLTARFPDVALATVRFAVERAYRGFDGCRVRQYIPVLVERAARETLAKTPTLTLPTIPFRVHHGMVDTHELWRVVTSRVVTSRVKTPSSASVPSP